MGFYSQYFSTLFKGVGMTALKERIEARNLVNKLSTADHLLYKSIWEDVEGKHKVSQAIREEKKLIEILRIASEKDYILLFNLSGNEISLLDSVRDIIKELGTFSKAVGSKSTKLIEVEKAFAEAILNALLRGEPGERDEYKIVMAIVNESHRDTVDFMSEVLLKFQKEKSQVKMLAKMVMRSSIKHIRVDIKILQQIPQKIRGLTKKIKGKDEKFIEDAMKVLSEDIEYIKKYLNDGFYELYTIQKRTLFMALKILLDLYNLRKYNNRWVEKSFMPREIILAKNIEIDKVETKVSNHFHTIAQSLRIIIAKTQEDERRIRREESGL